MSTLDQRRDQFEIGGEDLHLKSGPVAVDAERQASEIKRQHGALDDIRARAGAPVKTETVSVLLGNSASIECRGELLEPVPPQSSGPDKVRGSVKHNVLSYPLVSPFAPEHATGSTTRKTDA